MPKYIVDKELLERAKTYCTDEKTKKELESLLFRAWMEENDWRDIMNGVDKTTTFSYSRSYY